MAERSQARRRGGAGMRERPGNQTPNTPDLSETDLRAMKVDELRQLARREGISGVSALRKDELVKEISKAHRPGAKKSTASRRTADRATTAKKSTAARTSGVRRGAGSSESLKYAKEITTPEQQPERPGQTLVTTNHDVIRRWAEDRGAVPATVEGSEHEGHVGVLRFDFPGGSAGDREQRLRQISWDQWFEAFDARGLNFIHQEKRVDGRQSNFFQLENPNREDA